MLLLTMLLTSGLRAEALDPADLVQLFYEDEAAAVEEADLPLEAACIADAASAAPGEPAVERCVLQLVVPLEGADARTTVELAVAAELWQEDGLGLASEAVHRHRQPLGSTAGATAWVYLLPLERPAGRRLAVAVRLGDRIGITVPRLVRQPLPMPPAALLAEGAPARLGLPATSTAARTTPRRITALRLVPPRQSRVSGPTRFEVIVTRDDIERVVFELDGAEAGEDRRAPFAARIDLADPPRRQLLRATAYGAEEELLGSDELVLNDGPVAFRIAIAALRKDERTGEMEVTARVQVPAGEELDRVEFFYNEVLVETVRAAPFRARVPVPDAGPTDFLRVAAFLRGGATIDAVELLGAEGLVERLDVALTEVFAVVTDREGRPVTGLEPADFEVFHRGQRRPLEELSLAKNLPLRLGLVIDSSGSMEGIMNETKQAAGAFLADTLTDQDVAFVVDFDSQPRLVGPTTGDLLELLASFRSIRPEGLTALYDSIVFSLLELGTGPGRKAVVVLTDGHDYGSRYSPRRVIRDAREGGVVIYVIGLGEERMLQRIYRQSDLPEVTEKTGGRVYLVSDPSQLAGAYAEINRELRSQYLLTFYAEPDLDPSELEVRVRRPGLTVRSVVGAR